MRERSALSLALLALLAGGASGLIGRVPATAPAQRFLGSRGTFAAPVSRSSPPRAPRAQQLRMHFGHSHSHDHAAADAPAKPMSKRSQLRYAAAGGLLVLGLRSAAGPASEKMRLLLLGSSVLLMSFEPAVRGLRSFQRGVSEVLGGWRRHRTLAMCYASEELMTKGENANRDAHWADRITMLGVYVNVALAVGKFIAGKMGNSAALIADAGHSLSDLVSDFVTLWTLRMSRLPPDADHPYGHGRFEQLGSLFVAFMLLLTGWHFGGSMSITQLWGSGAAEAAAHVGHHHGHHILNPSVLTISMAAASIGLKEFMYRITVYAGKRLRSPVLIANAWHHRSDALSSVVALVGVVGARIGYAALDPWAGVIVAGMVALAGVQVGSDALKQLTDTADPELVREVERALGANPLFSEGTEFGLRFKNVRARRMGPETHVDLTVSATSSMSTAEAASIVEKVKIGIKAKLPGVTQVLVDLQTESGNAAESGSDKRPCPLVYEQSLQREAQSAIAPALSNPQISLSNVEVTFEDRQPVVGVSLSVADAEQKEDLQLGLGDLQDISRQMQERVTEKVPGVKVRVSVVLIDDHQAWAGGASGAGGADEDDGVGRGHDHASPEVPVRISDTETAS